MSAVEFSGPALSGVVEFGPDAIAVFSAGHDAPMQDVATIQATPEQADAIAAAFSEWAALARARAGSNQPSLFGLLP